ncbi:MAG: gliding motility-associated protein GldE [Bacteroidota bacterium]
MEDSPEPYSCYLSIILTFFKTINTEATIGILSMLVLLIISAMISGSELSFFSLNPKQLDEVKQKKDNKSSLVVKLMEKPKLLLATMQITNIFVNIAIIVLSSFVLAVVIDFENHIVAGFAFQVVLVTFLLLLFAEVLPKVYATQNSLNFALFMAVPMFILQKIFYPFSTLLVNSTNFIDKKISAKKTSISQDELSHAINITHEEKGTDEDKKLLYGIVQFSNIYAREIMKSRMDVVAVDEKTPFNELIKTIVDAGYSRIPVFKDSFDNVTGLLYIKDLLPYLESKDNFQWQTLTRQCFFVPESKKINDLLKEFQEKKIHMAIVVDEYGGTSGIITLEDILEEIVGDINDEFDIEETVFSKIDERTFIFEGKTLLKDFCKITAVDYSDFDDMKGEADTIAGLILEIKEELPFKGEKISFRDFDFIVQNVDNRRIKSIKVQLHKKKDVAKQK